MVAMDKAKAYVASPYGFMEYGRLYMRETFYPMIERCGITILDPWAYQAGLSTEQINAAFAKGVSNTAAVRIGMENMRLLESADLMVAVLDAAGRDVDSGVASEIGYAYSKRKPVLALKTSPLIGDCNAGMNLQVFTFIRLSGGEVYESLDALTDGLGKYLRRMSNAEMPVH